MGFNLISFLGGAAEGGNKRFKQIQANKQAANVTAEERQWQLATEDRADARSRKARRAAKKEEAEGLIGTMVALGMDVDAARSVAKNGKGAIAVAIKDLQYGRENGKDISSLYTMQNNGTITGDQLAEGAKVATLSVDSKAIMDMYGPVPTEYDNHNDQIQAISNKQLALDVNTPEGKTAYDSLEVQRNKLYKDLTDIAGAKDTSGGTGDDSRKFSEGTVKSAIQVELNKQLQFAGMSYDMEKQIIVGIQGDQIGANIAGLNTVKNLRAGTASIKDPYMTDTLNALESDSLKNVQLAASNKIFEYKKQLAAAIKANIQQPENIIKDIPAFGKNTRNGLRIGDIIRYPDPNTGVLILKVFTGTSDNNNFVNFVAGN
jgi:hypothetical protein|tara:strand:+ start:3166 stop:4290 length:1125 start_codon:yes stop_codon:yes gene_type:complete